MPNGTISNEDEAWPHQLDLDPRPHQPFPTAPDSGRWRDTSKEVCRDNYARPTATNCDKHCDTAGQKHFSPTATNTATTALWIKCDKHCDKLVSTIPTTIPRTSTTQPKKPLDSSYLVCDTAPTNTAGRSSRQREPAPLAKERGPP